MLPYGRPLPMSATVCRSSAGQLHVESMTADILTEPTSTINKHEELPDQLGIWTMIQSQKPNPPATEAYVHPLVRRSSNFMSQSSLEICTESLGSETGSCDSSDEEAFLHQGVELEDDSNPVLSVNYQCSVSRRSPTARSFPPPLSSISLRDGTCIQMRSRRHDGRLLVDAVPVSSRNYLHSRRHEGRLLLSYIDSTATSQHPAEKKTQELNDQQEIIEKEVVVPDQYQEEEDEEEVEVLDRGTMVEVKVSTQLQQPGSAKKVLRSSLVINKFVGGTPLTNQNRWVEPPEKDHRTDFLTASQSSLSPQRRLTATTSITTAAAAAVAASSASTSSEVVGHKPDSKLRFTSKRRNREEMLHYMQRCSELRRPLFFWEAGCIATSS